MQREIATKHRISDLESKIWLLNNGSPPWSKRAQAVSHMERNVQHG